MANVLVFRHVPHEHLGIIADSLARQEIDYRYVDAFEPGVQYPALDSRQGLIVMGGPMNADETKRYPFLAEEVRLIQTAVERRMPVLGVCLGSQLLAKALGAKVYPNGQKEIGWRRVNCTPATAADPILCHFARGEYVFQWHGDTFDLPKGAVWLLGSDLCTNQAFRYGNAAWGLQFHLEVTQGMLCEWFGEPENQRELAGLKGKIDPEGILGDARKHLPRLSEVGRQTFDAFCGQIMAYVCS